MENTGEHNVLGRSQTRYIFLLLEDMFLPLSFSPPFPFFLSLFFFFFLFKTEFYLCIEIAFLITHLTYSHLLLTSDCHLCSSHILKTRT